MYCGHGRPISATAELLLIISCKFSTFQVRFTVYFRTLLNKKTFAAGEKDALELELELDASLNPSHPTDDIGEES